MTSLFVSGTSSPAVIGSRHSSQSRERPRSGYRKLSNASEVDETLFSSHHTRPFLRSQEAPSPFRTTAKKKGLHGPPLLWAPPPITDGKSDKYKSVSPSPRLQNDSQKYRLRGHTPTFVDETLFGPKLEEPSFAAPWAERKRQPRPFNWAPPQHTDYNSRQLTQPGSEQMEAFSVDGRPPSRQGRRPGSTRTRPCTVESVASSSKSLWRP
ncbi:hypothetical protein FSP39_004679 [Pinctada imbricata]|uniref:RBPJ-interacting and tubulin-associated protein 1 n=1 Tax=Pinctada imbricata TaxID=66713 RepID=A0AA88XL63_PINIB|nr:hypothetical protein FSP39_004679 [Pinctada imbricata]